MTRVGRAIEKGETKGLMKIVVDAQSQEILGAAIQRHGRRRAVHCARHDALRRLRPARCAHPSDRVRAHSDASRRADPASAFRRMEPAGSRPLRDRFPSIVARAFQPRGRGRSAGL
jgi:hypothetical protein